MKTMLLGATMLATLATAVATPALAQTRSDPWRDWTGYRQGYSAYAYPYNQRLRVYPYGPRGYYRGVVDPDPTVRDQIRRDPTQGD